MIPAFNLIRRNSPSPVVVPAEACAVFLALVWRYVRQNRATLIDAFFDEAEGETDVHTYLRLWMPSETLRFSWSADLVLVRRRR